jgi:hypothetical protein
MTKHFVWRAQTFLLKSSRSLMADVIDDLTDRYMVQADMQYVLERQRIKQ